MAPNNALANKKQTEPPKTSSTTVLSAGTVESRGYGVNSKKTTREQVSQDISDFLQGEGRLSWTAETRAFFTVWTFVTRLPGPTWVDHHPGYLMRGMCYFPFAGTLVGIFVSVFYDLGSAVLILPPLVSACGCTGASLWVTGCFHEDGLADTADGFGGGWSTQQILKIMTDTRLGTYGCAVLMLYLVTKLHLLAALGTDSASRYVFQGSTGAGPALIVTHTLARLTAPFLVKTRDYVDEAGPKYQFYSFMVQAKHLVSWHRVSFALITSFAIAYAFYGYGMAIALIVIVLCQAHFAGSYGTWVIGGVMGDFLGATICVTELTVLTCIRVFSTVDMKALLGTVSLSWQDDFNLQKLGNQIYQQVWDIWMDPNHESGSLFRFVSVITIVTLWSMFVGHPPVLVRQTVSERQGRDAVIHIALNATTRDEDWKGEQTGRDKADAICLSPSATFQQAYDAVRVYIDSLAKPVGSLGLLEDWAARVAALQRTASPVLRIGGSSHTDVQCLIFAGDHGVAADKANGGEGCSAYPQIVTRSVLVGLEQGIAGASVLARCHGVPVSVVDVGVAGDDMHGSIVNSSPKKLVGGTKNFCEKPAMTVEEVERLIKIGRGHVEQCVQRKCRALVLGEVGIGNTTPASALIVALTDKCVTVESICGGGATTTRSADDKVIQKKIQIVKKGLALHEEFIKSAYDALGRLGGAEIASLVGAMLEASDRNIPVLVDGFIVTAAALVAASISPYATRCMLFTSLSAEPGQQAAISAIQKIASDNGMLPPVSPALNMALRMGESSAALVAVPILGSAVAMLNEMGTLGDIFKAEPIPNVPIDADPQSSDC